MSKLEIGSDWDIGYDPLNDKKIFYHFRSCRDILNYIICSNSFKTAILPAYCCESVIDPFHLNKVNVSFYSINKQFEVNGSEILDLCKKADVFLFIDYFGNSLLNVQFLEKIKMLNPDIKIIYDKTQNLYDERWFQNCVDYTVCSLRKWFPIPDGAVLATRKMENIHFEYDSSFFDLKLKAFSLKYNYLHGKNVDKNHFINISKQADLYLKKIGNFQMSDYSQQYLMKCNFSKIKIIRKQNFEFLKKNIQNPNITFLKAQSNSLYFPIATNDQSNLQKILSENNVYCPIIWNINEDQKCFGDCAFLSNSILCIPIDQRYTEKDMNYICIILNGYKRR